MDDLLMALSVVITIMSKNGFPLIVPPRYLIDPFGALERVVTSVLLQLQLSPLVATYGTSRRTQPKLHYSLSDIMKNPLRHYPSPLSLYSAEPDGALLTDPVFAINFGGVKEMRNFTRGKNGPTMCVLRAIDATRVSGDSFE